MSRSDEATRKRKAPEPPADRTTTKKSKTETTTKSNSASKLKDAPQKDEERPAKSATKSVLSREQPAFPRGGASVLTPLEKKQISAQAWREAEREAEGQPSLFDDRPAKPKSEPNVKSSITTSGKDRKQKKGKNGSKSEEPQLPKDTSIGGLSYKRLVVGSLLLGRVAAISDRDLTISLPNNLIGFVPITAISNKFRDKVQQVVEKDGDADDGDDDIDLDTLFAEGQLLRVAVVSLSQPETSSGAQGRKRIELSVEPTKVNIGLDRSLLVPGVTVQASIASVEDHGLVVDLDLEQSKCSGFIPAKHLPEGQSLDQMKEGAVLLCQVAKNDPSAKVVSLSASLTVQKAAKAPPTVDAFLPGTVAEILLTEVQASGLVGKVMGALTTTADILHSGAFKDKQSFAESYKVGAKVKGRLLYKIGPTDDCRYKDKVGATIAKATIVSIEPGLGAYLDLGSDAMGFAHISRLADGKTDAISATSGPFKVGSTHKARITDFGAFDGLYGVSLQQSVLDQRYLRLQDVSPGDKVLVKIEKVLIGPAGIKGLIVKITDTITGFIPNIHLSDAVLSNPEKKFREGVTLKARVLYVDTNKREIRLTAKKTLVNTDLSLWTTYGDVQQGQSSIGTLIKVDANGALVQFFGDVKGFLPVAEMSEAYIKDAREHFQVGKVMTVHMLSVDPELRRLTVSCRETAALKSVPESAAASLKAGTLVNGTVFEKASDDILLRIEGSASIARLSVDHVSDGSLKKRKSALDKIRVGQTLEGLLVLDIQAKRNLVILSNRKSLAKAAAKGTFLTSFEGLEIDKAVTGFVSNITSDGVFVSFASRISALIPTKNLPDDQTEQEDFGMTKFQAVTAKISKVDFKGATPRFWLSLKESVAVETGKQDAPDISPGKALVEPVDANLTTEAQLIVGAVTKARISSVKESQLNVELAKDVQGRIDVSEIYDQWEDIKDRKKPLQKFAPKQIIDVRILGAHDTRTHRFLPLSHRSGKTTVYELTARPQAIISTELSTLGYEDLKPGDSHIAFVNNIESQYVWANISPSVRGRIMNTDLSDDLATAADVETNFPIGSALRVRVTSVDTAKGRLDLSGRSTGLAKSLTINDLAVGQILAGRVTKLSDRQVILSLSDDLAGAIDLIDLADDYRDANTAAFQKNEIVRACVVRVDVPNKKVSLSTRPSKILSSSLPVADPELTNIAQINVNDVYRGFIRNVDEKGIFVTLGHGFTAFVRVSNLSDDYLKEWKDGFQRDQLVKGKVISVDKHSGHIQMSLKESVISTDYKPPMKFTDLHVGDIVTGTVAKVAEFGVFILVDNSEKIRGLCHRSEIAERRIEDARKLFKEGDAVKAKILKVDLGKRQVNFGLKASYIGGVEELEDEVQEAGESDADIEGLDNGVEDEDLEDSSADEEGGTSIDDDESEAADVNDAEVDASESNSDDEASKATAKAQPITLKVGGFDWHGISTPSSSKRTLAAADSDEEAAVEKPKKRKKRADIEIDRTGDLDAHGPQSADDFERLLLSDADSSMLWLQYMAFHMNLGDVDEARQIGERALKSIGLGQDAEKQNIWVALLNLEVAHGDDDSLDAIFQRACEYNDPKDMHGRLVSGLIQAHQYDKADDLFQTMLKKYTQDPKIWTNYATFLFDTKGDADKARDILPRALQTLPQFTHLDVTSKFAQLEFKSEAGVPERGRTIFEGLIASFPKRIDLYNVLLDLELKVGDEEQIRTLFERVTASKLKPKQAKYFFKRWLEFEQKGGDEDKIEAVQAKAATWVREGQRGE
ncbi:rRNA biogenesis protein rrp5 [Cyphellophora attinorum]|uniref:rRNA biogenesis protein RRP5 n=1 Tax=Cyphellophora attinorum TaxID=1664694 RepID=A0A0N0NL87_9EURO|nr:rRNA biogenesis protein rrp5 [Phialophora attinorum]KPI39011.1 rRNA biogenesis protein rrp5 [Phialophora attinorum]